MTLRIEDYALIGDLHTAALVGKNGSIDWLCLPRFDSPSCFTALLGDTAGSRWQIEPLDATYETTRTYRDGSLVLETTFTTAAGAALLTDYMPLDGGQPRIIRTVRGLRGTLAMRSEFIVRFDYGSIVPWVRQVEGGLLAIAGPDALLLSSDVKFEAEDFKHAAAFSVKHGETVAFELAYFQSYDAQPAARLAGDPLVQTENAWAEVAKTTSYAGPHAELVRRSLLILRALTYEPTGGIVAAPTTSLPERIGGVRNWDYRLCWLRDASLTLLALSIGGYSAAAREWKRWLLRAVAGEAEQLQICYSIRGTRRLPEIELDWLEGYEGSKPVRIGNGAYRQFQLDVYGDVMVFFYAARKRGIEPDPDEWPLAKSLMTCLEHAWKRPDRSIWEMRGAPEHFTHSKVMAWAAADRAVRSIEDFGLDGPVEAYRALRDEIHADVLANAFDAERNTFVQSYGSSELDAATLFIPLVGFLEPNDPRVLGTIAAIERELMPGGFVERYSTGKGGPDDLPGGEGAFLACSFWLVSVYYLVGRRDDAVALFEKLAALVNDVGLLAEEYDPVAGRQVGNFPQAFSHVGLVVSAFNLWHHEKPLEHSALEANVTA